MKPEYANLTATRMSGSRNGSDISRGIDRFHSLSTGTKDPIYASAYSLSLPFFDPDISVAVKSKMVKVLETRFRVPN